MFERAGLLSTLSQSVPGEKSPPLWSTNVARIWPAFPLRPLTEYFLTWNWSSRIRPSSRNPVGTRLEHPAGQLPCCRSGRGARWRVNLATPRLGCRQAGGRALCQQALSWSTAAASEEVLKPVRPVHADRHHPLTSRPLPSHAPSFSARLFLSLPFRPPPLSPSHPPRQDSFCLRTALGRPCRARHHADFCEDADGQDHYA